MKILAALWVSGVALLAGCQQQASPPPPGFAFDRGERFLAAGSPKSAIPFLTQTVTAQPDGPEPMALLSLAYALDLQPERAIMQARQVRRPRGTPRGWEFVAVGVAKMTQHLPDEAVVLLRPVAGEDPQANPVALSARQWLALAQLLNDEPDGALTTLTDLSGMRAMKSSALLWSTLIHEQRGQADLARAALIQAANCTATESGRNALAGNLGRADAQSLYDAGIAALGAGELSQAEALFVRVRGSSSDAGDTAIWQALLAGVRLGWPEARARLREVSDTGPEQTRGLANQLFSVVCAMEDRPELMVQYTLTGQRLMGRTATAAYVHEQPQPDTVWFSDLMK
jgi:hypothetical protein